MEDLECEAIEKEGWDHQSFLEACGWLYKPVPQKSGGTHVPLAVADGEHVLSNPFGYYFPTGHSNWDTHPHNFPYNHIGDTCTSKRDQTMMSPIWPGESFSKIRGGWSHSIRHDPGGVAPPKAEKQEASGKAPERRLLGGLFKGHGNCQGSQASLSSLPQENVCPGRVLWPEINFQRNGSGGQPPEHRDPWGVGGLGRWAGTKSHQACCKNIPMGGTIFLHHITIQVTKHHGVEGDTLPWGPTSARQSCILPLVWQGGAEWEHCDKSFMQYVLLPRLHMCPMLGILCHEFRCYETACILLWDPNHHHKG